MLRRSLLGLTASTLTFHGALPAEGSYPNRPIRLIVPFPPGGGTDIWARLVAEGLQADLGQPIIIDNREGDGGLAGTEVAAKAAPDGYTLLYNVTTHVQAPVAAQRFPYDPIEDFFFVGRLGTTALTFCIGPAVPKDITTLAEFLFWGRERELVFGNYGWGSTGHAFGMMLSQEARLNATQIAYSGEAPMLGDLLIGNFHGGFHSAIVAGEMMRSGRIRPLATGGSDRVPSLAGSVPLLSQWGVSARFNFTGFSGLFAPAGIPREVQDRLVPAFHRVATGRQMAQRLQALDTTLGYEDSNTFRTSVQRTFWQWVELAEAIGLSPSG
jgi:tripartite-type tricarboxylate transporter receptor subunit TctC